MLGFYNNGVAIYVERIPSRKQSILWVEYEYPTDFEGEPVTKRCIERVAFFRSDTEEEIFKAALKKIFETGSCGIKVIGKIEDLRDCFKCGKDE